MRLVFVAVAFLMFVAGSSGLARELYPGQYAQMDPTVRQWFRSQRVPGGARKGGSCCSEADGVYAEEDIRADADGTSHYWVRFEARSRVVDWMKVPDEVVIHDPNRNGAPVVWWGANEYYNDGVPPAGAHIIIFCYAPGAGI
jgi:hypothetical protein